MKILEKISNKLSSGQGKYKKHRGKDIDRAKRQAMIIVRSEKKSNPNKLKYKNNYFYAPFFTFLFT